MLKLHVIETDDQPAVTLKLEHSLLSLSKWEQIHHKPFFSKEQKTEEEVEDYVRQMILNEDFDPDVVRRLSQTDLMSINTYMNDPATATWFPPTPEGRASAEIVTNELIYHWMIDFKIPFKPCDEWHLNRLMTMIKVRGAKQTPPKRMSKAAQAEQMRKINAERRAALGTKG